MQYKGIFSLFSGVLETPSLPPQLNIETVSYKIILTGKPAVGKTSTVAKLLGQGKMDRHCAKKKKGKIRKFNKILRAVGHFDLIQIKWTIPYPQWLIKVT